MSHSAAGGDAPQIPEGYFTAEQVAEQVKAAERAALEKARTEERTKLYGDRDKQKEQFDAMQAELAELRKAETTRTKEAERIQREAEKARQAKLDAEKSAKELLAEREQTWQAQLEQTRQEQAAQLEELKQAQITQQAMYEKQREMDALALYIQQQASAHTSDIAPELIDLIDGDTKEQVDASVADLVARTGRILEGMRQAAIGQRAGMPGVSPSGGATALTPGIDTGDKQITAEDIKGMSMADFRALRERMGMPNGHGGRGIFG